MEHGKGPSSVHITLYGVGVTVKWDMTKQQLPSTC